MIQKVFIMIIFIIIITIILKRLGQKLHLSHFTLICQFYWWRQINDEHPNESRASKIPSVSNKHSNLQKYISRLNKSSEEAEWHFQAQRTWKYTDVEQILNSTAVRSCYEAHGVCKNYQLFGESDDEN